MTSSWQRVRRVAEEALGREGRDRAEYVEQACEGDLELLREVRALLSGSDPGEAFLAPPAIAALRAPSPAREHCGLRLGAYRLTALIGTGGMGSVYRAARADDLFEKEVAIKLLDRGIESAAALRRFQRERQLLATLEHPNVTRLLDGGTTPDGRPYIVMELIDGSAITSYCDTEQLGLRDRLTLFGQVCAAVHYAHRNLVVHCDLKPGNVLVSEEGIAKLLDFGISRLLEAPGGVTAAPTASGPMSARYSSPEQAAGEPVTTSSDVYSLGVVLDEIITAGRWPCALDDELRAVVAKATAAEPESRYDSAEALAVDLRRYLAGDVVLAHPGHRLYRLRKVIRRHAGAVAAAVIAFVAIASLAIAAVVMSAREAAAHRITDEISSFLRDTFEEADPTRHGRPELNLLQLLGDMSEKLAVSRAVPAVKARLHLTLGRAFLQSWRIDEAEPHVMAAIGAFRATPDDEPELADALDLLGEIRRWRLDPVGAERALNEALQRRLDRGGSEQVVESYGRLAEVLMELGRHGDAEQLYARAMELAPVTTPVLARLAVLRAEQGRAAEALDLAERARGAAHGFENEATATEAFAEIHAVGGAYDRAAVLWRRAIALREAHVGARHPSTLPAAIAAAFCLQEAGDSAAAEDLYRQTLATATERLPRWHRTYAHVQGRLGFFLMGQRRYAEAEPLLRGAYETQVAMAGKDHVVAVQLAECLRDLSAELRPGRGR